MARNKYGFTLIELLIVVAIIAILAAIAVPNFLEAQTRAKVSRTKTDMRSLAVAVEAYRVDHNDYPFPSYGYSTNGATDSTFDIDNPRQGVTTWTNNQNVTTPVAYITSLPRDVFSPEKVHWFGYCRANERVYVLTSLGPNLTRPDVSWADWQGGEIQEAYVVGALQDAQLGPLYLIEATYDPTNGTVSAGDIWRSNLDLMAEKLWMP
jgi:type II secretion system protein G